MLAKGGAFKNVNCCFEVTFQVHSVFKSYRRSFSKIFLSALLVIFCIQVSGQSKVRVAGVVRDRDSKRHLQGVSVTSGKYGGITDSLGQFMIEGDAQELVKFGITFSHLGYKHNHADYVPSKNYQIELSVDYNALTEVKIIGSTSELLLKVLKRIPINYPEKAYRVTGPMRLEFVRSTNYLFNSNAVTQYFIPGINSNQSGDARLIENKLDSISNPSLIFIRWIGGYNAPLRANIVQVRPAFLKETKIKDFRIHFVGRQLYHGHQVFVLNFRQRDSLSRKSFNSGTLYIDTLSYAIAGADISFLNVKKYGMLPQSRLDYHVRYEPLNGRWYLHETFTRGHTLYKAEHPTTTTSFVTAEIDTNNHNTFTYEDKIQSEDITQHLIKKGNMAQFEQLRSTLESTERYSQFQDTSITDSLRKSISKITKKPGRNWLNYFTGDNMRSSVAFVGFPVRATEQSSGRLSWLNYGVQLGAYFRVYRKLFFQFEGSSNFGTNRTNYSQFGLQFANDFYITHRPRSFILTPFIGYNFFTYKQKDTGIRGHSNYFIAGIRNSLELDHKVSLYLSTGISDLKLKGDPLLYPNNISAAIGFIIKR